MLLAGCSTVESAPGHDFAVEVLTATPLVVTHTTAPVGMELSVVGCDALAFSLVRLDRAGADGTPLAATALGDGRFALSASVSQLRDDTADCEADDAAPAEHPVAIAATCLPEKRRVESAPFAVRYVNASRTYFSSWAPLVTMTAIDGMLLLADGRETCWLGREGFFGRPRHCGPLQIGMLTSETVTPIVTRAGFRFFAWVGCRDDSCQDPVFINGELVNPSVTIIQEVTAPSGEPTWPLLEFPGIVTSLRGAAAGDLVALGRRFGGGLITHTFRDGETLLTSEFPGRDSQAVSELALSDEGQAVFSAVTDADVQLLSAEGAVIASLPLPAPALGLSLSPDATRILVFGDGVWLADLRDAEWARLPESPVPLGSAAAWGDASVVIWNSHEAAAYARAAPHALLWRFPPTEESTSSIVTVEPAGDGWLVGTKTGARLLDANGQERAGLDPLPCDLHLEAAVSAAGDGFIAVGGREYVYIIDLPGLAHD